MARAFLLIANIVIVVGAVRAVFAIRRSGLEPQAWRDRSGASWSGTAAIVATLVLGMVGLLLSTSLPGLFSVVLPDDTGDDVYFSGPTTSTTLPEMDAGPLLTSTTQVQPSGDLGEVPACRGVAEVDASYVPAELVDVVAREVGFYGPDLACPTGVTTTRGRLTVVPTSSGAYLFTAGIGGGFVFDPLVELLTAMDDPLTNLGGAPSRRIACQAGNVVPFVGRAGRVTSVAVRSTVADGDGTPTQYDILDSSAMYAWWGVLTTEAGALGEETGAEPTIEGIVAVCSL